MNTHRSTSETIRAGSRHAGLLTATTLCLFVAAFLIGGYALWHGNALLGGLGLQLLLAAISVLSMRLAGRLRNRFASARDSNASASARFVDRLSSRWGDGEEYEPDAEDVRQALREDLAHDRNVHFLFLELGPALVLGAIAVYTLARVKAVETPTPETQLLVFGLICLAASCVWFVLARSFESLSERETPGASKLGMLLRETQWASLLGAAALLGSLLWAPLETWMARLLIAWVVAICGEQLIRAAIAWRREPIESDDPVPPYLLTLRQSLLVHGNPLTSLFESFERRFGVSFRSSWTIRFMQRAFVPMLLLSGMMYWGLTSLTLIGPSEVGLRESFGVVDGQLGPGLHGKVPWPFGVVRRFDVKRIYSARVGAEAGEEVHRPRAILWSKSHAHEEFPLVLGTGTDAVSVDALIYYKIREDSKGLLDFAYHTQDPIAALQGYAMRSLMEHTRSATLDEVLSVDRAEYANRIEADMRQYVTDNHLGIEIVDLALINLHPPIASAAAYLDVISAEIDAVRFQLEAEGENKSRIQEAEKESGQMIANARAAAARRVGQAVEESAQFVAVGGAFALEPEAFKLRMSGDTVAEVLGSKPLTLIDPTFFDGNGQIMLDLRRGKRRTDAAELR